MSFELKPTYNQSILKNNPSQKNGLTMSKMAENPGSPPAPFKLAWKRNRKYCCFALKKKRAKKSKYECSIQQCSDTLAGVCLLLPRNSGFEVSQQILCGVER